MKFFGFTVFLRNYSVCQGDIWGFACLYSMFDGMKRRIIQIKFVNLPHLTKYQKN